MITDIVLDIPVRVYTVYTVVTCVGLCVVVPVEMIAGFNRMKAISQDVSLIVKAMRQSDMLEVCYASHMVLCVWVGVHVLVV